MRTIHALFVLIVAWLAKKAGLALRDQECAEVDRESLRWLKTVAVWIKLTPAQRRILLYPAYEYDGYFRRQEYDVMVCGEMQKVFALPYTGTVNAMADFSVSKIECSSGDELIAEILKMNGLKEGDLDVAAQDRRIADRRKEEGEDEMG